MDNLENKMREREIIEWIKSIGTAIVIALIIKMFLFSFTTVNGASMEPTLENGDFLFVEKYSKYLNIDNYRAGDIVLIKSPYKDDNRIFVKRIVGVEGDIIDIENGLIYVNDEPIYEDYIERNISTNPLNYGIDYSVPNNHIYVVGDNRHPNESDDSRSFGSVPITHIVGKVKFRVFPWPHKIN